MRENANTIVIIHKYLVCDNRTISALAVLYVISEKITWSTMLVTSSGWERSLMPQLKAGIELPEEKEHYL